MGFLKRLFSIGGKNKKQKRPNIVHNVPLPEATEPQSSIPNLPRDEEDHEAAIGRLLRSSSQRYAVVAEIDYTNMPPMPHPINDVINPPSASTVSLASSTLGSRTTYNVTVHRREGQSSSESISTSRRRGTETPKAKRYNDSHLNANDSRVLRLRSDPSVASLVSLYDEHGRLPEAAFSNSPPSAKVEKTERAQCKRSGSTLRQLLGVTAGSAPSRDSGDFSGEEGDISWAERFLGELDNNSTHSSLPLPTPITENGVVGDVSIASMLSDVTIDNPAISSMDVELSISTNASEIFSESFTAENNGPYKKTDPATPQRASQVFDFITKKKQSKFIEDDERPLPEPPSAFSSPSSDGLHSNNDHLRSQFSEDSCESAFARERISAIPIPSDTPRTYRPTSEQINSFTYKFGDNAPQDPKRFSFHVEMNPSNEIQETQPVNAIVESEQPALQSFATPQDPSKTRPVKVLMTGPTKVIVTAPTPSSAHPASTIRIPRGPRSLSSKRRSSGSHRRSAQLERSNTGDLYSVIPTRRRTSHQRSSSTRSVSGSSMNGNNENENPHYLSSSKDRSREKRSSKGNTNLGDYISKPYRRKPSSENLGVKADIPLTPLRSQNTNTSTRTSSSVRSSLYRSAINQDTYRPPSAEVSPSGKHTPDLRQQRSKAREAEREKSSVYSMMKRSGSVNVLGRTNGF